MGAFCKLIDFVLFFFFAVIAVSAPLIDGQTSLPSGIYPEALVDLKKWYSTEFGDYLFVEKPNFLVGLVWHELLFLWPLSIANIYAILAGKSWFGTSCLLFGASIVASMAATLGELLGSGKASDKLLMMYVPFLGFGMLAILRGLVSSSSKTTGASSKRSAILARKKRA
ncbi:PREDICTED: transmembrane protein 97 [Tarenaya hassleriana]|uniref:transmembrane protein 97 n=1 Tax=Tarenaya hassleriana TaxID=28532 RepID=UPI00053C1CDD|nr:PREDICTED: transmembrane protein 97 [Tarenaya hassleriana]